LLLRPDGNGKLSKRDGDRLGFPVFPLTGSLLDTKTGKPESFSGYREAGYFPDAFINMLALLGWHSSGNQELYTLDELVKEFSLDRVSKSGAKFDPEKTKWFNQQYLRKRSDAELADIWMAELKAKGISTTPAFVLKAVHLVKEKAVFTTDFWSLGSFLFEAPKTYDAEVIKKRWNEKSAAFVAAVKTAYEGLTDFSAASTEASFKQTAETLGIKTGEVMQLFRVCLSGAAGGPALFEMAELLGKDEVIRRLDSAIQNIH
ncbi:MAG TPA: glutamate--tRNA ligase family protein, partial [Bacteroidia bacterium]|nr:glutamate--tRNA ligase family protein [Bacteroidia bacterium]